MNQKDRPKQLSTWMISAGITLCCGLAEGGSRLDTAAVSTLAGLADRATRRGGVLGIEVVRADDGSVLFARKSSASLIPASNIKILTTAAALHFLGADYQFRTRVFGEIDHSGTAPTLYIKGFGDPWLVPERIWYLANQLHAVGLRKVAGDLIVDESFFDDTRMANGSEQDHSSYAYMAPAGALSVGFNAVEVVVRPGAKAGERAFVSINPPSAYTTLQGSIATAPQGRSMINVSVQPQGKGSLVRISGRINVHENARSYWRRIDNPPYFAGEVLRTALRQAGIEVGGEVKVATVPEAVPSLQELASPRLASLVATINKHSNNFMAAQLARTVGAEVYGAPASWEKAERAIAEFLSTQVGIAPTSYQLGNASGLHDVNRMSAHQIVQVLRHLAAHPQLGPEFVASLAVAGGEGTLHSRMEETSAIARLRAKTGTLSVASALSGYVTAETGELLVFSYILNDYKAGIETVWDLQDRFGAALASLRFANAVGTLSDSKATASTVSTVAGGRASR